MTKIGIVAYEVSADLLGEGLMHALRERIPQVEFVGVVGERMERAGCERLLPAEHLAVMGLVEVLRHLPGLLRARRKLVRHFLKERPDLFIGIDAPDFNLGLETRLRAAGIPTVHYVSPTFWAWRRGRVKTLRRAADLVLSIFPFERDFLEAHGVNCRYVGHHLAELIPLAIDRKQARERLSLAAGNEVLAILPGSRVREIESLAGPFLGAARILARQRPGVRFLLPCPKQGLRPLVDAMLRQYGAGLDCQVLDGDSHDAMAAADLVLTASGTATLEALMHKRPMVVGYRVSRLTALIVRHLIRVPYVAMANLLAGEGLAPELLQQACEPERIAAAITALLDDRPRRECIEARYAAIHRELHCNSSELAAEAIIELLQQQC
ncbi:MAG: lipid-A-disaccharide synthase [Gammaproteobacteria bacterium]|nr:lipid-A-disaccharide synthase [Gammaproteobacteria bacterium]MBU1656090.1 lipid-A-disaccharide synthase [Gammaproteobacteria bacterium]MBU1962175.1 lipid-A-disaccharide synthase [Gammaproteobacteria bacterium]